MPYPRNPNPTREQLIFRYAAAAFIGGMALSMAGYMILFRYERVVLPRQKELAAKVDPTLIAYAHPITELFAMPAGEENAADHYMRAVRRYNPAVKDGNVTLRASSLRADGPEMDQIVAGTFQAGCRFHPDYFSLYTAADSPMPPMQQFQVVSSNLGLRVESLITSSYTATTRDAREACMKGAVDMARSEVIFGIHLASERLSPKQFLIGLETMQQGFRKLSKALSRVGLKDLAATSERFRQETIVMLSRAEAKLLLLRPFDENYVEAAIRIAREDEDPMFRAVGLLILRETAGGVLAGTTRKHLEATLAEVPIPTPDPDIRLFPAGSDATLLPTTSATTGPP